MAEFVGRLQAGNVVKQKVQRGKDPSPDSMSMRGPLMQSSGIKGTNQPKKPMTSDRVTRNYSMPGMKLKGAGN